MTDATTTSVQLAARHLTRHFLVRTPGRLLTAKHVVRAVEDVSLDLVAGKVVAVVGESGSGKSVLARMLARIIKPTSGDLALQGTPIAVKSKRTLEYASHCWLAVPDASMVRDGELPAGWGLLCPAGIRGLIAKVAPVPRQPEPLTPSAVAALLRAAVKTAVARERRGVEADRESQLFDLDPDTDAEPDDGALFGTEEAS